MINVDLRKKFKDTAPPGHPAAEDGLVETPETLGTLLASFLKNHQGKDSMKFGYLAMKLAGTGVLEVDEVDFKTLHTWLKDHSQMAGIIKYQINEVFEAASARLEKKAA